MLLGVWSLLDCRALSRRQQACPVRGSLPFVVNMCTCSEPMVPVPAEAAVTEQANVVRELKEGKGLTNQNEEVQAAVAELIKRKEKMERIQHAAKFAEEQVPTA